MMRPWNLGEANYGQTRQRTYQVAVLPMGATEPHNLHLPYGTDTLEATTIGQHICQAAHDRGAEVVLLPTVPFGTQTNMRQFPLAINLNPSTLARMIRDIVGSLADSGIHKLLLLNSHGGNEFKSVLRELAPQTPVQLFLCDWYRAVSDIYDDLFEHREDHAGEMETSLALAYFPDLVARTEQGDLAADQGDTRPTQFEAVNRGWVTITRPWHLLTTHSGAGNPHAASAEKGHRLMEILVERLASFLVELAEAELDEHFPFKADPPQ